MEDSPSPHWINFYLRVGVVIVLFRVLVSVFLPRYRGQSANRDQPQFPVPPEVSTGRWPIVGHAWSLGRRPHRTLAAWAQRYSTDIFTLQLWSQRVVVLNGSVAIRSAFSGRRRLTDPTGSLDGRPDFDIYQHYSGGHSISFHPVDGPTLRSHRRLATVALAKLISTGLAENIVRREANQLVENWLKCRPENGAGCLDPSYDVTKAIASALYSMCYGVDERLEDNKEYSGLLLDSWNPGTEMFAIGQQTDLRPWYLRFLTNRQKQVDHIRRMSTHVELNSKQVTNRHLPSSFSSHSIEETDSQMTSSWSTSIVDTLMMDPRYRTVKCGLTEDRVTQLPVEFLSAGSETSSATLLWLIRLMAEYTDIQERVQAELDAQLEPGCQINYSDRHRLPFTEAVILEASRLMPVVPLGLPHYTRSDVIIDVNAEAATDNADACQFLIPASTIIYANLWSAGRDPLVWSNPDKFVPERFLLNVVAENNDCSLPLSGVTFTPIDSVASFPTQTAGVSRQSWASNAATVETGSTKGISDGGNVGLKDQSALHGIAVRNSVTPQFHSLCEENQKARFDCALHTGSRSVPLTVNRKLLDQCSPFGVGRRRCVGEPLGRQQVFILFATLMRSCRIVLTSAITSHLATKDVRMSDSYLEETFGDVVRPVPFKVRVTSRLKQ